MSEEDRKKWDARYATGDHASEAPSRLLTCLDDVLPTAGRALDVAGGAGRHAIWLARRGLEVTLADGSPVALKIANERAAAAGVAIEVVQVDFEQSPCPAGPWDLIVSFHYLHRPLFEQFPHGLAPGGLLVFVQGTMTNLTRNPKPPARFLLDDDELPSLVRGLEIVRCEQGWLECDQHVAWLVARKPID